MKVPEQSARIQTNARPLQGICPNLHTHCVFSLLLCVCAEGNGCREKSALGLVSSAPATVEYSAKSRPHMWWITAGCRQQQQKKPALSDTSTHTDGRCAAAFDWAGKQRKWAVFLEWMLLCFFSGCRSSVCFFSCRNACRTHTHTHVHKQGAHKRTFLKQTHYTSCTFMYGLFLKISTACWTVNLTAELTYKSSWMACGGFDRCLDLFCSRTHAHVCVPLPHHICLSPFEPDLSTTSRCGRQQKSSIVCMHVWYVSWRYK